MIFFHMLSGLIIGFFMNDFYGINLMNGFFAFLVWVIFLNGGTLALNSYHDKDEGDIGWLDNPPKVPAHLDVFAYILMLFGLSIAYLINGYFFVAYSLFFVMSILYSVPPFRFKERPGFDMFINGFGYGVLTIYAGYSILNLPLTISMSLLLVIQFLGWSACYPLSQLYQDVDDKKNGYQTFSLYLGKKKVLRFVIFNIFVTVCIVFLSVLMGYFNRSLLVYISLLALYTFYFLYGWFKNYKSVDEKSMFYKTVNLIYFFNLCVIASYLL